MVAGAAASIDLAVGGICKGRIPQVPVVQELLRGVAALHIGLEADGEGGGGATNGQANDLGHQEGLVWVLTGRGDARPVLAGIGRLQGLGAGGD